MRRWPICHSDLAIAVKILSPAPDERQADPNIFRRAPGWHYVMFLNHTSLARLPLGAVSKLVALLFQLDYESAVV